MDTDTAALGSEIGKRSLQKGATKFIQLILLLIVHLFFLSLVSLGIPCLPETCNNLVTLVLPKCLHLCEGWR